LVFTATEKDEEVGVREREWLDEDENKETLYFESTYRFTRLAASAEPVSM